MVNEFEDRLVLTPERPSEMLMFASWVVVNLLGAAHATIHKWKNGKK